LGLAREKAGMREGGRDASLTGKGEDEDSYRPEETGGGYGTGILAPGKTQITRLK